MFAILKNGENFHLFFGSDRHKLAAACNPEMTCSASIVDVFIKSGDVRARVTCKACKRYLDVARAIYPTFSLEQENSLAHQLVMNYASSLVEIADKGNVSKVDLVSATFWSAFSDSGDALRAALEIAQFDKSREAYSAITKLIARFAAGSC